jgi:two-component system chemotaxis response regulator CheB
MKVFIADDSILIRNIVKELLSTDPNISIVGEAANGADAVSRAIAANPDIVIMDIDMPIMNGLEATAQITAASSIPVMVFTHNTDPELPFKALERGAVDFLLKPDFGDLNKPEYVSKFISHLRGLSTKRLAHDPKKPRESVPLAETPQKPGMPADFRYPASLPKPRVVVIGASTGGPQAVSTLLSGLKVPYILPIILVQHIETGFDQGYADWLSGESGHRVILAKNGVEPQPGTVYVAPTDFHLRLSRAGFLLDDGPKVLNQKPSVDVLFASAADSYGDAALGVLLTGMGTDGAEGCAAIQAKGGYTLVQDEASSLIFGMPKAAIARGAASVVLPLHAIAPFLDTVAESLA